MMDRNCIKCGAELIIGENTTQYNVDHSRYVCRSCLRDYNRDYNREYMREYRQKYSEHQMNQQREYNRNYQHRTGRQRQMGENKECPQFLGVHVAERVLSHVFKNVQKMPYGHVGFDFICGGGYKIDVKSSCRRHSEKRTDRWNFGIKRNHVSDYFLCLAFDNREELNPEHIWLIPSKDVDDHVSIGIAETMISKWDKYELGIDKVVVCCNTLRTEQVRKTLKEIV